MMQQIIAKTLPALAIELLTQKLLYFNDVQEWPDECSPDLDYDGCKAYFPIDGKRYRLVFKMRGNRGYWYMFGRLSSTGKHQEKYVGSKLIKKRLIELHEYYLTN